MVKIKRVRTIDAVVVGWRPGKEEGTVGSLILGLYDEDGELRVVGHSSGLKAKEKRELVGRARAVRDRRARLGRPEPLEPTGASSSGSSCAPSSSSRSRFDHVSAGRIRHGSKLLRWRQDHSTFMPAKLLGLVGESGSGKSTLGRLVLRLIEPSSGSVRFEGRDLLAASHREMRRLRRDMQIIFQDPFGSLDPRMNVEDIISEPLVIHEAMGLTRAPRSRRRVARRGWPRSIRPAPVSARIQRRAAAAHRNRAGAGAASEIHRRG